MSNDVLTHREQEAMIDELREVSFPLAVRGYDRAAVDRYVEMVNRVIAELEISRSPEAAVKAAVAQVSEETRGILERAHEAAEEITARSRSRADDRIQEAEAEAAQIRGDAEQHVRQLDADTEAIWSERHRLIEDVRQVAEQLAAMADEALVRFPAAPEQTHALPAGDTVEADVVEMEPVDETEALEPEDETLHVEDEPTLHADEPTLHTDEPTLHTDEPDTGGGPER
jgi:DivIVA domain-containing protein